MKILMFAASLRKDSYNKKLIHLVKNILEKKNINTDLREFSEFNSISYNQDIQDQQGFPTTVQKFVGLVKQADAIIISVPEYNYSIPGTLKNLIDWVSRVQSLPFKNSKILLMSASPSLVGGNRGLWSARIPLEACNAFVFPDMFSLSAAHEAFDEHGKLKNTELHNRLVNNIQNFLEFVNKFHNPN